MNCIAITGKKVTFKANFDAQSVWALTSIRLLNKTNNIFAGWVNHPVEVKIGGITVDTFSVSGRCKVMKSEEYSPQVTLVEPELIKYFKYFEDRIEEIAPWAIANVYPEYHFIGIKKRTNPIEKDGKTYDGGIIITLSSLEKNLITTPFFNVEASKKRDFANMVVKSNEPMDEIDYGAFVKAQKKSNDAKSAKGFSQIDNIASIYFPKMKVPVGYKFADLPVKTYPLTEDNIKDSMKTWDIVGATFSLYGLNYHPTDVTEKTKPGLKFYGKYFSCEVKCDESPEDDFFATLEAAEEEALGDDQEVTL